MEPKSEWLDTFNNLKRIHNAAYKSIEEAFTLEENEKSLQALEKYEEGIELIDRALNIFTSHPNTEDRTWETAYSLILELKQTRAEVLTRINCLKSKHVLVPETGSSSSDKISSGIVAGAGYLARRLVLGAETIGCLINYATPELINNLPPSTEETPLPSAVSKGIKFTETATNRAAQVTEFVADQIGQPTSKLGQFLAPHIQKHGTRILQSSFNYNEAEASSTIKDALTIASGAAEGIATVYNGLEKSADILGHNLRDNTVKIVKHKYGSAVGEVTMDTLNTVGNVVNISRHAGVIKSRL